MHRPLNFDREPDLLTRRHAIRKGLPWVRRAVVHPCDPESIEGANLAARAGLIDPVFVGPDMDEGLIASIPACSFDTEPGAQADLGQVPVSKPSG
ncbi:MAG: hypothetical protein ACREEP_18755 [Dongiaceae bacterium]